jgi:hypothetical protein
VQKFTIPFWGNIVNKSMKRRKRAEKRMNDNHLPPSDRLGVPAPRPAGRSDLPPDVTMSPDVPSAFGLAGSASGDRVGPRLAPRRRVRERRFGKAQGRPRGWEFEGSEPPGAG